MIFFNEMIEEYKNRKIIINIDKINSKNVFGDNKKRLEDISKINYYHQLENKFEDKPNKEKKVKI